MELVVQPEEAPKGRGYGSLKDGLLYMSDDFDEPLEEFAERQ